MKTPSDFDFTPRRIEQDEELNAVAWAENNGWEVRKMQYRGRRGCADRFFFGYSHIEMIEFKKGEGTTRPGELSIGQSKEHQRLAAVGTPVRVFYSDTDCIAYLKTLMVQP